jgi:hypothetical protein
MSCQEVIEILDNQQVEQLDAARRRSAEAHVAVCADCARVWHAQASLASLPDLAMPADFQDQCRVAVAARAGAATGRRVNRRVLLWGSLATLAAAAATLLLSGQTDQTPAEQTAQGLQTQAPPVVDVAAAVKTAEAAPNQEPETASAVAINTAAAPRFTVRVVVPEPSPVDPAKPLPVEEKELNAIATDPAAQEALQALRAALIAELRKVPDLAVVDKDPAPVTSTSRHYRVRIAPSVMFGYDGRPMRKEHRYDIGIAVQEVQPGGAVIDHRLPIAGVGVDPLANCTSADAAERMPCEAPKTAAFLVRYLRDKVFPADASVTQPLQARFRDSSLAPEERFKAFVDLFKLQAKAQDKSLLSDAGVVRAAAELSGLMDAAHRAQLWRAMRGVGDPLLIEPLLASLQQDPEEVRIAAVETLAADFSGNQRARSALETTALSDSRPLVRALAQRGLTGEERWQNYVESSLEDAGLPASERVEALLYELYPPATIEGIDAPSPENYWEILKGLDDGAVRALAEAFPKAAQLRKWPGNNLVGNFAAIHNQNPAVTEMLLTVLEHDTRALNRASAGQRLAETHAGEPRVRDALTKAVASDPDASVRNTLSQILERDYVKKAMQAPVQ